MTMQLGTKNSPHIFSHLLYEESMELCDTPNLGGVKFRIHPSTNEKTQHNGIIHSTLMRDVWKVHNAELAGFLQKNLWLKGFQGVHISLWSKAATIKFIVSHDSDKIKPKLPQGKKNNGPEKKLTPNLCKKFYYKPTIHREYSAQVHTMFRGL